MVPRTDTSPQPLWRRGFGAPTAGDWALFCIQWRSLLEAGVPLTRSLELLAAGASRERVRRLCLDMAGDLAAGRSGLAALERWRGRVPPVMPPLLAAGLRAGNMPAMLGRLVRLFQWQREMWGLALRGMLYPLALVVLGTAVMIIRDTVIASVDAYATSDPGAVFVRALWGYGLWPLAGVAAAWGLSRAMRVPVVRARADAALLMVPLLGRLAARLSCGAFLEVLAAALETGMPVTVAWEIAADSAPNHAMRLRLGAGLPFLRGGESLGRAIKATRVFPREAVAMVETGEISGAPAPLMRRVAGWFEGEIRAAANGFLRVAPLFVLFLVGAGYFVDPRALALPAFALMLALFTLRR